MKINSKMGTAAATIALVFVVVAACIYIENPEEPAPIEEDDILGAFPIAIIVGMLIMASLGVGVGWLLNDRFNDTDKGGDTETLRKINRENEASSIQRNLEFLQNIMSARTIAGADSLKYLSTFAERQAEVAVSTLWTPTGTFSADEILSISRIYERLNAEATVATFFMSQTFNPFTELIEGWNDGSDNIATYANGLMKVGFSWDGGDTMQYSASPRVQYGFGTTVTDVQHSKVFIDPTFRSEDVPAAIYVYGGSASLTSASDNTQSYGLVPGYNDISGIPTGIYMLQEGRSYIGNMFPVADIQAADVVPAAALVTSSDIAYAFFAGSGVNILHSGTSSSSYYLQYVIEYDGLTQYVDLMPSLGALYQVQIGCIEVLMKAGLAAQAQWILFNMAGESLQFISPSSILPDLVSLDVSPEELALITAAALMQISDFVQRNQTNMTTADIRVSASAMDLVCFGDIRDNFGNTVAANVAYTPYNWVHDVTLKAGTEPISWDQAGVAAVWGPADSFTGTDGMPEIFALMPGYVLVINGMTSGGAPAYQFDLEVIPLPQLIDPEWKPHPTHPGTPDLIDVAQVVALMCVLFSLLIILANLLPTSPAVIIAAILIALIGYLAAGLIVDIIWGTPPWWWPF